MTQSYDETRFREGTAFLCDVASLLSHAQGVSDLASRLARSAVRHFADTCAVHILEDDGAVTLAGVADRRALSSTGAERSFATALASREGLIRGTMRSKEPLVFNRGSTPRSIPEEHGARLLKSIAARSVIVVPITMGPTCIGTLSFAETIRAAPYRAEDVAVAVAAGNVLSLALESTRLQQREHRLTDRSRFLARATDQLFSTLERTQMLQLLLDVITEELADWAIASSLQKDGLHAIAVSEKDGPSAPLNLAAGTRIFGELVERDIIASVRQGRPLLVNEVTRSPAAQRSQLFDEIRPRAWMMAPLSVGGHSIGSIVCYSTSRRYDDDDLETLQELCLRASLALEHAETFARERRLTQTLQQATLPTNLAEIERATLSAVYLPAHGEERVGGDWYDAFPLDGERVLLTVGDVTGHGLQASVIMGKLRHALNVVAMYETDPSRILDVAEQVVLRRYPDAMATAFIALIDRARNVVTYSNAGHPAPIVRFSDGSVSQLVAGGLPIGLRRMHGREPAVTTTLEGVELLVLYTDGVTESSRNALEGEERLMAAVGTDTAVLVRSPAEFLQARCLGWPTQDDVAILAVNFSGIKRWGFDAQDQTEARRTRREIIDHLRATVEPDSDFEAAELIYGELVANAARHASGPVDVALTRIGTYPVLHVIDRGAGCGPIDSTPANLFAESGRGLWLVRQLSPALEIEYVAGFGTHARAVLPVRARDGFAAMLDAASFDRVAGVGREVVPQR